MSGTGAMGDATSENVAAAMAGTGDRGGAIEDGLVPIEPL